jgi:hypothetical protein
MLPPWSRCGQLIYPNFITVLIKTLPFHVKLKYTEQHTTTLFSKFHLSASESENCGNTEKFETVEKISKHLN